MPGYLESILDIYLNPVIIFLPRNVVKEKLTFAGRGGGDIPENVTISVREAVRHHSNTYI